MLVNPNLNIELSSFSETFEELMSFPNYPEFAEEFAAKLDRLYIADGYSEETNINNMIVQLLILEGYISSDDLAQGSVIEKVNRETIAAAKHAVVQYLNRQRSERPPNSPGPRQKKRRRSPNKSGINKYRTQTDRKSGLDYRVRIFVLYPLHCPDSA